MHSSYSYGYGSSSGVDPISAIVSPFQWLFTPPLSVIIIIALVIAVIKLANKRNSGPKIDEETGEVVEGGSSDSKWE